MIWWRHLFYCTVGRAGVRSAAGALLVTYGLCVYGASKDKFTPAQHSVLGNDSVLFWHHEDPWYDCYEVWSGQVLGSERHSFEVRQRREVENAVMEQTPDEVARLAKRPETGMHLVHYYGVPYRGMKSLYRFGKVGLKPDDLLIVDAPLLGRIRFPYRIMPGGFILSWVLCWVVIAWGAWAVRFGIAVGRARAGRCWNCGYPESGAARCAECGEALRPEGLNG